MIQDKLSHAASVSSGQRLETVQLPEGPQLDGRVLESRGTLAQRCLARLVQIGGGGGGQVDPKVGGRKRVVGLHVVAARPAPGRAWNWTGFRLRPLSNF